MPNETFTKIMEVPLFIRAAIVFFILWFIYMLVSRSIFKLIQLIPILFNFIWVVIYRIFNNLMHLLHRRFGRHFATLDQTVTDMFGSVYRFTDTLKNNIDRCCWHKYIVFDREGREQKEHDGSTKYYTTPKKPFAGAAFLLSFALVVWISAPVWLHIESNDNFFTSAYHTYIEAENWVLIHTFSSN